MQEQEEETNKKCRKKKRNINTEKGKKKPTKKTKM